MKTESGGFAGKALLIVVLAAVTVLAGYYWIVMFPFGLIRDDGYFYAQLAYQIGSDFRSSFDGIHVTDGYHPLWGWILGAVSFVGHFVTDSKHFHMGLLCVFNFALIYAMSLRYTSGWVGRIVFVGLALMGSLLMETLFLALLVLEWIRTQSGENPKKIAASCVLVFLLPLSRIDAISVVLPILVYSFLHHRRLVWKIGVAGAAGVGCHFVFMKAIAGHWISVSSYLKSAKAGWLDGKIVENIFHGTSAGLPANPLILILLGLGVTAFLALLQTKDKGIRNILLTAWVGATLFSAAHFWLSIMRPWYYLPGFLVYAHCLFESKPDRFRFFFRLSKCGILVAVIGFVAFIGYKKFTLQDEVAAGLEFIENLGRHVPENEPIFQIDGSGYVGFFSPRPIVNGDGLMNTHQYAEKLASEDLVLQEYLKEEGICYVISNKSAVQGYVLHYYGLLLSEAEVRLVAQKSGPRRYAFTNYKLYQLNSCAP